MSALRSRIASFFTKRTALRITIFVGQVVMLVAVLGSFLTLCVMFVEPFT